jgi:hypothetical protein
MKKEIYVLVGPASIGKSTFVQNVGFPKEGLRIINRDDIVGNVTEKYDLSYDDIYQFPPHDATPDTFIAGKEHYGRIIVSPPVVHHLQPFSFEYLDSVGAEINYTFYNEFQTAIRKESVKHIIIDRVHMRSKERKIYMRYLEPFREKYVVTAVLFNFTDPDTLDVIEAVSAQRTERMKKNGERYRTVPRKVQENMIKHYEEPTLEEGFDVIHKVDTLPELRKLLLT